jgi:hypothetical protein
MTDWFDELRRVNRNLLKAAKEATADRFLGDRRSRNMRTPLTSSLSYCRMPTTRTHPGSNSDSFLTASSFITGATRLRGMTSNASRALETAENPCARSGATGSDSNPSLR